MFLVLYQPQYFTLQSHKLRVVSLCSFRKNSYPSLTSQYRILFRGKRSVPETFACSISCRLSTSYSRVAISWILVATLTCTLPLSVKFGNDWLCYAEGIERDLGKVGGGAASSGKTSTGVSRTVTRGVNLSGADFSGQDLSGISFQQSLLRETDFHGAKLVSASFFGAELSYANLEDADLTEANLELANLRNAKLKNAVLRRAYFSGNTRLENADIEGADFSEVILRKDQRKYLCAVAKGKNSHTGVETKKLYMPESPRCGFLSCGFPRYSRVTRRSDCLSFNTFGCRLIRRRLVKKGPVENLSWRPLVHQVAMSTTTAKTRYIESDFSVFRISPNEEELVSSFGDYFVEIATTSVQKQGSFTLAISGGSVLQCFSKAILETPNRRERVFWENTFIFLVDERYVPWDDPQSNYGQLRKALRESGIEHKVKVFPVNTSLSLEEAASSYEQDILSCESQSDFIKVLHQPVEYQVERVPAFDLILLGLGEDGHTASLFPNKELLGETKKLVGYERNSPKPPSERITLTYPALNYAKNVAFIVVGKGKAEIMRKLCEDHSVQYPARLVAPIFTRKDWFVDEDAMSKIGAAQDTPVQRL